MGVVIAGVVFLMVAEVIVCLFFSGASSEEPPPPVDVPSVPRPWPPQKGPKGFRRDETIQQAAIRLGQTKRSSRWVN